MSRGPEPQPCGSPRANVNEGFRSFANAAADLSVSSSIHMLNLFSAEVANRTPAPQGGQQQYFTPFTNKAYDTPQRSSTSSGMYYTPGQGGSAQSVKVSSVVSYQRQGDTRAVAKDLQGVIGKAASRPDADVVCDGRPHEDQGIVPLATGAPAVAIEDVLHDSEALDTTANVAEALASVSESSVMLDFPGPIHDASGYPGDIAILPVSCTMNPLATVPGPSPNEATGYPSTGGMKAVAPAHPRSHTGMPALDGAGGDSGSVFPAGSQEPAQPLLDSTGSPSPGQAASTSVAAAPDVAAVSCSKADAKAAPMPEPCRFQEGKPKPEVSIQSCKDASAFPAQQGLTCSRPLGGGTSATKQNDNGEGSGETPCSNRVATSRLASRASAAARILPPGAAGPTLSGPGHARLPQSVTPTMLLRKTPVDSSKAVRSGRATSASSQRTAPSGTTPVHSTVSVSPGMQRLLSKADTPSSQVHKQERQVQGVSSRLSQKASPQPSSAAPPAGGMRGGMGAASLSPAVGSASAPPNAVASEERRASGASAQTGTGTPFLLRRLKPGQQGTQPITPFGQMKAPPPVAESASRASGGMRPSFGGVDAGTTSSFQSAFASPVPTASPVIAPKLRKAAIPERKAEIRKGIKGATGMVAASGAAVAIGGRAADKGGPKGAPGMGEPSSGATVDGGSGADGKGSKASLGTGPAPAAGAKTAVSRAGRVVAVRPADAQPVAPIPSGVITAKQRPPVPAAIVRPVASGAAAKPASKPQTAAGARGLHPAVPQPAGPAAGPVGSFAIDTVTPPAAASGTSNMATGPGPASGEGKTGTRLILTRKSVGPSHACRYGRTQMAAPACGAEPSSPGILPPSKRPSKARTYSPSKRARQAATPDASSAKPANPHGTDAATVELEPEQLKPMPNSSTTPLSSVPAAKAKAVPTGSINGQSNTPAVPSSAGMELAQNAAAPTPGATGDTTGRAGRTSMRMPSPEKAVSSPVRIMAAPPATAADVPLSQQPKAAASRRTGASRQPPPSTRLAAGKPQPVVAHPPLRPRLPAAAAKPPQKAGAAVQPPRNAAKPVQAGATGRPGAPAPVQLAAHGKQDPARKEGAPAAVKTLQKLEREQAHQFPGRAARPGAARPDAAATSSNLAHGVPLQRTDAAAAVAPSVGAGKALSPAALQGQSRAAAPRTVASPAGQAVKKPSPGGVATVQPAVPAQPSAPRPGAKVLERAMQKLHAATTAAEAAGAAKRAVEEAAAAAKRADVEAAAAAKRAAAAIEAAATEGRPAQSTANTWTGGDPPPVAPAASKAVTSEVAQAGVPEQRASTSMAASLEPRRSAASGHAVTLRGQGSGPVIAAAMKAADSKRLQRVAAKGSTAGPVPVGKKPAAADKTTAPTVRPAQPLKTVMAAAPQDPSMAAAGLRLTGRPPVSRQPASGTSGGSLPQKPETPLAKPATKRARSAGAPLLSASQGSASIRSAEPAPAGQEEASAAAASGGAPVANAQLDEAVTATSPVRPPQDLSWLMDASPYSSLAALPGAQPASGEGFDASFAGGFFRSASGLGPAAHQEASGFGLQAESGDGFGTPVAVVAGHPGEAVPFMSPVADNMDVSPALGLKQATFGPATGGALLASAGQATSGGLPAITPGPMFEFAALGRAADKGGSTPHLGLPVPKLRFSWAPDDPMAAPVPAGLSNLTPMAMSGMSLGGGAFADVLATSSNVGESTPISRPASSFGFGTGQMAHPPEGLADADGPAFGSVENDLPSDILPVKCTSPDAAKVAAAGKLSGTLVAAGGRLGGLGGDSFDALRVSSMSSWPVMR